MLVQSNIATRNVTTVCNENNDETTIKGGDDGSDNCIDCNNNDNDVENLRECAKYNTIKSKNNLKI